jgi:phosphopentomutase
VIVLDACGAGALPDAADYGDEGANTLAHLADRLGGLTLPTLQALGLGSALPLKGVPPSPEPVLHGRLHALGAGKDSTAGHWELMGLVAPQRPPVYPEGFPEPVIALVTQASGREVLCNRPSNGLEAIERFGATALASGSLIVYTSQDSVLQIAAHVDVLAPEALYEICAEVRRRLPDEHAVGRVIARPFVGPPGVYVRTAGRHDFSLQPPVPNHLQRLREAGVGVHGVGKIHDIFAGRDIDDSVSTASNGEGIARTQALLRRLPDRSFVFTNLVETDMLWGHRNDPRGFADALEEFDEALPQLLGALRHGDLLVLTSDHGCDPTTPSTDHSREHALLLAHVVGAPMLAGHHDGDTFADVGATVLRWLTGAADPDLPGTPVV